MSHLNSSFFDYLGFPLPETNSANMASVLKCNKFSGYSSEDAMRFLEKFVAYLKL